LGKIYGKKGNLQVGGKVTINSGRYTRALGLKGRTGECGARRGFYGPPTGGKKEIHGVLRGSLTERSGGGGTKHRPGRDMGRRSTQGVRASLGGERRSLGGVEEWRESPTKGASPTRKVPSGE